MGDVRDDINQAINDHGLEIGGVTGGAAGLTAKQVFQERSGRSSKKRKGKAKVKPARGLRGRAGLIGAGLGALAGGVLEGNPLVVAPRDAVRDVVADNAEVLPYAAMAGGAALGGRALHKVMRNAGKKTYAKGQKNVKQSLRALGNPQRDLAASAGLTAAGAYGASRRK